jgi:hypothetical protein
MPRPTPAPARGAAGPRRGPPPATAQGPPRPPRPAAAPPRGRLPEQPRRGRAGTHGARPGPAFAPSERPYPPVAEFRASRRLPLVIILEAGP